MSNIQDVLTFTPICPICLLSSIIFGMHQIAQFVVILSLAYGGFSSLESRQSGRMDLRPPDNKNTWVMDYIGLTYSAPCSHSIDTRPEVAENLTRTDDLSGSFYLQRSKVEYGARRLWVHESPELRISCESRQECPSENGWRACKERVAALPYDGGLSSDLKSRLKWRLRNFKRSADGRHFERVTIEVVNVSPPGRS
jgi:hypothetical protein